MITVILIGTISVLITYFSRFKEYKYGLELAFVVITMFLALRYNYGNDYKEYHSMFNSFNAYGSINYTFESYEIEPGWKLLNRLFKPFGFYSMVAAITIFQCLVYYKLIKNNVPTEWQWFAVFLFVFSPEIMLTQASMMRQALAISIFVLAIDFIYKKKIIQFLISILVGYTFHQSFIILLPLILFGFLNFKITKFWFIIGIAVFFSSFIFQNYYKASLNSIIMTYFSKYDIYLGIKENIKSGIGIIIQFIFFIIILITGSKQTGKNALYIKLLALGFMIIPISLIVQLVGRISLYLTITLLVGYPMIANSIKNKEIKYSFVCVVIAWTLFGFFSFLHSDIWSKSFERYQTIIVNYEWF